MGMSDQRALDLARLFPGDSEMSRRMRAFAMTGFAGRQDREMALRAGFDEHIAKPVQIERLLERVRVLEASRDGG